MGRLDMKVLGIVGLPGSGKGEFSKIAEQLGIPVVVMGDVIREEVQKIGLPPTGENMGIISKALREKDGMAAIAIACIPVVERQSDENKSNLVLIDGLRSDEEMHVLRDHFPDFVLIAINAPDEIRLTRLCSRGRSDDIRTREELQERDARETSFGLLKAIKMADLTIENKTDINTFKEKVESVLNDLMTRE